MKKESNWQLITLLAFFVLVSTLIITISSIKQIPTGFVVNEDGTDFISTYDFTDSINNKAYYTGMSQDIA